MAIELVEVKVDTNINRKTVVVFDSYDTKCPLREFSHAELLAELFPNDALFLNLYDFTLASFREGNVAVGITPQDLLPLNPAVFILDPNIMPSLGLYIPTIALLKNLESEKRLSQVKRIVITDFLITRGLLNQLLRFGITEANLFSWRALASAREFRNLAKIMV